MGYTFFKPTGKEGWVPSLTLKRSRKLIEKLLFPDFPSRRSHFFFPPKKSSYDLREKELEILMKDDFLGSSFSGIGDLRCVFRCNFISSLGSASLPFLSLIRLSHYALGHGCQGIKFLITAEK